MGLNQRNVSFGVHQATIKDLVTLEMFPILILGSVEPDVTQEMVDLRGGSSAFPHASAPGEAAAEIALTIKEYSAGVMKFFSPYKYVSPTDASVIEDAAGDPAGDISAITNAIGTSVVNATTGIASIADDADDSSGRLKYGDYLVKAASATTVDIYINTDIDDEVYVDDTLKITDTPITIPGTGGTVESKGLEFTGGSGAIAMTPGDIAKYSIRPVNSYLLQHQIGRLGAMPREFELVVAAERIDNRIRIAKYPKCIASGGAGLKFPYKEWAMFETTIKLLMDPTVQYAGIETIINR